MLQSTIDQYFKSALYFDDPTDIAKDKCGNTWMIGENSEFSIKKVDNSYMHFLEMKKDSSLTLAPEYTVNGVTTTNPNYFIQLTTVATNIPRFSMDFWISCGLDELEEDTPYLEFDFQNSPTNLFHRDLKFYRNKFADLASFGSSNNIVNYSSIRNSEILNFINKNKIIHITLIALNQTPNSNIHIAYYVYLNNYLLYKNSMSWTGSNVTYTVTKPIITIQNTNESSLYFGYFRLFKDYTFDITNPNNNQVSSVVPQSNYYYNFDFDNIVIM